MPPESVGFVLKPVEAAVAEGFVEVEATDVLIRIGVLFCLDAPTKSSARYGCVVLPAKAREPLPIVATCCMPLYEEFIELYWLMNAVYVLKYAVEPYGVKK